MKICSRTIPLWVFFLSFKLLLAHCTECYKLSMSIMSTIFDVSIKEKRVYGSLCFELLPQQMSQSKKKYMDLCQHANKYTPNRSCLRPYLECLMVFRE